MKSIDIIISVIILGFLFLALKYGVRWHYKFYFEPLVKETIERHKDG